MSTISLKAAALVLAFLGVGVGGIAATAMTALTPASNTTTETILTPHNLNLRSQGNFVTAILKNVTALPDDLKASDLAATATVSIGGADEAVAAEVRAYNDAGDIVIVKIDRQEIASAITVALEGGGSVDDPVTVTVTVTGGGESVTRTGTLDWFTK